MSKKEIIISNSRLNSYGFRVLTSGIDCSQYKRNPIILWNHHRTFRGTKDEVLPIGRMENLRVDEDNLIGTPVFDEGDDFAKRVKEKFENGFLKMASVGIDVVETSNAKEHLVPGQTRSTVTRSKLIEVSIVDIGANDDALALYSQGRTVCLNSAGDVSAVVPEIVFKSKLNDNEMKIIALKLGLPETATETEILTKIGELESSSQRAVTLQKELDEHREAAIVSEVATAIAGKKITADKRQHFEELGKTVGLETLRTTLSAIAPAAKPMDVINREASGGSGYKKLSEVPEKERIELRANNKEEYARLYEAEYGCDFRL